MNALSHSHPLSSTEIQHFLTILHPTGSVFEIRSLRCPIKIGSDFLNTAAGWFTDPETASQSIEVLESRKPPAIYVTVNPVDPSLLARGKNRIVDRANNTSNDENILRRRWLFIDIDAKRPAGISATDAELHQAEMLSEAIVKELTEIGWPKPLEGMSGNGRYLLYRIDLENSEPSKKLVKKVLQSLAHKFDTAGAEVDCSTFNAARLMKVLGTVARKGDELAAGEGIEARPHRQSWFIEPDGEFGVVSESQLHDVAAWIPEKETNQSPPPPASVSQAPPHNDQKMDRASKYLAKLPPSIEGDKGSDRLYRAACEMVRGFDLSDDQARELLLNEFNPRCQPPWSEPEIKHKIDDAREKASGSPGYHLKVKENNENSMKRQPKIRLPKNDDELLDIRNESGRTDVANAQHFITQFEYQLIYIPEWKKWLVWDGQRWHDDNGIGVQRLAQEYSTGLWGKIGKLAPHMSRDELGALQTFVKSSNQLPKIQAFIALAAADERVVYSPTDFNSDPLLLNVMNGTIDLTTGTLRPHDPADGLTQLADVIFDPAGTCPEWDQTLQLIFNGDAELIQYVQRLLGYCLSGDIGQQIMPIAVGKGANGKSTIANTVLKLMGDYAMLGSETLLLGSRDQHPTDKASLYQKRFVVISEPERNSLLKESRVKELTGDTHIIARRMREDFWTFERTHKFFMLTNHLPPIDGLDDGIWRRLKVIPFNVNLNALGDIIPNMVDKLLANESSGILNWLLTGWNSYRETENLTEPDTVKSGTAKYRQDSHPLGEFIEDYCVVEDGASQLAFHLYASYRNEYHGELNTTNFGTQMGKRFEKKKLKSGQNKGRVLYLGIRLKTCSDNSPVNSTAPEEDLEVGNQLEPVYQ